MSRRLARILAIAGLLPLAPVGVAGQTVTTVGSYDVALDRRLDGLLLEDPLVVTETQRIAAGDTIRRPVLVLDATLILEGTILGDLVVVDGGVFVRNPATVRGDVVNIGGGLYRSDRARIGGTIIDLPDAPYRVIREPGRFVIEASGTPSRLVLDGPLGLRVPSYDRVNGLTAAVGARYRLPILGAITPVVRGYGGWRTEAGEPVYGGFLHIRVGPTTLEGGYERTWKTRDAWILEDLDNSLNYLWNGNDHRNYFDVERRVATVSREFGDQAKSFFAAVHLTGQVEDATSLEAGNPWHLTGDTARANPPVDDGRITSATARFELAMHGLSTDLRAYAEYEAAREWEGGEHTFDRVAARVDFAMQALFDHTLEIGVFGQIPLGQDTLPVQRWSMVGGSATLQTLPISAYRGDHVLMVETRYRIPVSSALALPVLGEPELQLLHAAGLAWVGEADEPLVQEVGAALQFFGPYIRYMLQPDDPSTGTLLIGAEWPLGASFPWES